MRVCELTGKRRNVGYNVSHAHNKTKKVQHPNIQKRRIWIPEKERYIKVKLSTSALRSVNRVGFKAFCRKQGIDYERFVAARLHA